NSGVVTYTARVTLPPVGALPLRVGMTTDVAIVITGEADVLVIPTEAVQRRGVNEYIQVLNADNTTREVAITSGTTVDGLTAITGADIETGMTVVIPEQTSNAAGGGGFGGPFGG
ncbi:MAG: hypothetical protein H7Y11_09420, partial [Armatimonadetes bacterium]|nr:hypothetical protein [Anaerolineae bacterium]